MLREVLWWLNVREGGVYLDCTVGAGGHSKAILDEMGGGVRIIGIDRDEEAIEIASQELRKYEGQVTLIKADFRELPQIQEEANIGLLDGIMYDLGLSSMQLDSQTRGFSFRWTAPLDMRMDTTVGQTAADLVNNLPEQDLKMIFREYGEERRAGRIAGAIARSRKDSPITGTVRLAEIVERAAGGRRGRIHPATKVFQALRIAVNDELGSLRRGLEAGLNLLVPGGRMAVISFHSLEDRIVKQFFVSHAGRWESLAAGGEEWVGEEPRVRLLNKKPRTAGDAELSENPRSRSAKLRVAERITPGIGRG